jgi:sterol desaturase/sphingolipid hydroxylase (fatty acid hydroxylase superfamily)
VPPSAACYPGSMQDGRSPLERWIERVFADPETKSFGSGWISGTCSVFLGFLTLLGVLAFRFPDVLSSPELRARYSVPLLRSVLETAIALGFVLGCVSMLLRERKVLGCVGVALALLAAVLGGGSVEIRGEFDRSYSLGLDWFILNLLLLALVFVPLERAFPLLPQQKSFRFGWATDGTHFLISHLALQILTFLTLLPATTITGLWQPAAVQGAVASQSVWLQLFAIVLITDLTQYWVHRAFHRIPFLWRFHAIHHSSRAMDWLAGSRLHVFDVIVTRGLVILPVFLLGFSQTAVYAYLVFVGFHAVFIHANLGVRFGRLDHWIATPRVHHWHHAMTPTDRNFAVHLPVLDRIFGTLHLPDDSWPEAYGIAGHPVPEGWLAQLVAPLRGVATEEKLTAR